MAKAGTKIPNKSKAKSAGTGGRFRLADLPTDKTIKKTAYFETLKDLQTTLLQVQQAYLQSGDSAAIVFEGWDAAGKGGTIRRMSAVLDPRGFKVWPIAAPRNYYKERHYLSRFFERLPPSGAISVFDRSWYGRVLVERVEGLATAKEWSRAYDEINAFEKMLVDNGTRVVKLFLHITPDEQLKRFEERLRNPMKRWKLSYEDFRNRDKWDAYTDAIEEMVACTSTKLVPWHVVPANDKRYARIQCLRTITKTLAENVDLRPPPLSAQVIKEAMEAFDIDIEALAEHNHTHHDNGRGRRRRKS